MNSMKYCEGSCRRRYFKYEKTANACKYHRGYNVGIENDNKIYEVCLKPNMIMTIWYKILRIILGDILDIQDIKYGSRKSTSVEKNRKAVIKKYD